MNEALLAELVNEMKTLNRKLTRMNQEVFSAEEAAKYLRIGYSTMLQLARIGQIEHVRNGTSYIFKKEHLNKWLDRNKKDVI